MMEEKKYCVYKHTNKINGKVYIGLTGNKPEHRWNHGRNYKHNAHFTSAIKKYGWDNFEHEIIMDGMTLSNAQVIEMIYIALNDSNKREYGYNLSDGGEVIIRRTGRDNPSAKDVYIVDNDTREIIAICGCIKEAAEYLGITKGQASDVLYRIRSPINNMDLVHEEHLNEKNLIKKAGTNTKSHPVKRVQLIEPDGTVVYYDSKLEAAKANGINKNTLGFYCRGERRDPSGRRWRYWNQ